MTEPVEVIVVVRVELSDELKAMLTRLVSTVRQGGNGGDKTWSEARKEALRYLWPIGAPIGEIRRILEHLPGAGLPGNWAIAAYANGRVGVSRSPGFRGRPPSS